LVLSAAPAEPTLTATRNAGAINIQRAVRVISPS
jgi:hypothetical protein